MIIDEFVLWRLTFDKSNLTKLKLGQEIIISLGISVRARSEGARSEGGIAQESTTFENVVMFGYIAAQESMVVLPEFISSG